MVLVYPFMLTSFLLGVGLTLIIVLSLPQSPSPLSDLWWNVTHLFSKSRDDVNFASMRSPHGRETGKEKCDEAGSGGTDLTDETAGIAGGGANGPDGGVGADLTDVTDLTEGAAGRRESHRDGGVPRNKGGDRE